MTEQHDQVGAGGVMGQRLARRGAEAGPTLPCPRLGKHQHHTRATGVAADQLATERLAT